MKTIFLSKTFWVQIAALLMLLFPPVKAWFDANPVDYLTVLAAANVLLRFFTRGAVSFFPAGPDDDFPEGDNSSGRVGTGGSLLGGGLLLATAAGGLGLFLPSCASGPLPISGTVVTDQGAFHYDSKGGLSLTVDRRSAK